MKHYRFVTLIALVMLFCLGLHSAGYAQGTVTVTTPGTMAPDPSPIPAGPGYEYFTSAATLHPSGLTGELTLGGVRYQWTAKMTKSQSGSGFSACNAPTDFRDVNNNDTSTKNPTMGLRTVFATSGYYQLTLSVTVSYDLVDQNHNVVQTNTATGYATAQIEIAVPDFSMSGGNSLTIPLEGSSSVTVSATNINYFLGTISLGLGAANPNPGQATNPAGLTLGSTNTTISLAGTSPGGSSSVAPTVNVAATAIPGTYPLTIYGDGSYNGPSIEHSTSFNLTIPRRYVEIDGPFEAGNKSKTGPNTRNLADGSISVDSVIGRDVTGQESAGQGTFTANTTAPDGSNGFMSSVLYDWHQSGDLSENTAWLPKFDNFASANSIFSYWATSDPGGVTAFGKSSTISVDVKNSSGSKITSTSYTIHWHLPGENFTLFSSNPPIYQESTRSSYDHVAGHNGSCVGTWSGENVLYPFLYQAGPPVTSVGGNFVVKWPFGALIAAVGTALQTWVPQPFTQPVNFNDAWSDSNSTFNPKRLDNTSATMQLYKMSPTAYSQYTAQIYHGDGYGPNGYTGPVSQAISKWTGRNDYAGDFILNTAPNP